MDAPTLHAISEVITSVAALCGVLGAIGILSFLLSAIRKRILSGADVDMNLWGGRMKIQGKEVTRDEAILGLVEVVPSLLTAVTDLQARVERLGEPNRHPQLPAAEDGAGVVTEPLGHEQAHAEDTTKSRKELGQPFLMWIDGRPGARAMQIQQAGIAGWQVGEYLHFELATEMLESPAFWDGVVYVWGTSGTPLEDVRTLARVIAKQPIERRTRLLVYTPEDRLPAPRLKEVLDASPVLVTASAVDLAVALTGTYCGKCQRLLAEPNLLADDRPPCPQCGSTIRHYKRDASDTLMPTVDEPS